MSTPICDREGSIIGYQDDDGTLRDAHNKKIGHITREGAVYDNHKEQVGRINARGDVIDRYGRQVGSVSADGTVLDWHGIQVYSGSAAPLLIDFEKKAQDPLPSRFNFDRIAREANVPKTERAPTSILPEGFVSPSVIGCLGIVIAVVIGIAIMFVMQNPSLLSRNNASPTLSAVAQETSNANLEASTPAPNAAPNATATPKPVTGKVNAEVLNLRQGPATSFDIVDRLQQNTEVVLVGRLGDSKWLRVTVPGLGKEGWVAAEYVDAETDIETLPVVPPPSQ
ncbi:MAG: SH3 domain-containing protein [Chloroflexota bacterium]|nr:MAG: SH3 domain-containing protein [Chloroflexota bacterium]